MLEEKIKSLLEGKLKEIDIWIDQVIYEKEGSTWFLRIIIDSENIIDLDKCVEATNIISPILDKEDLIEESYILDVCSKERGEK